MRSVPCPCLPVTHHSQAHGPCSYRLCPRALLGPRGALGLRSASGRGCWELISLRAAVTDRSWGEGKYPRNLAQSGTCVPWGPQREGGSGRLDSTCRPHLYPLTYPSPSHTHLWDSGNIGPDTDSLCRAGEPQAPTEMGMLTPLLAGMMAEFNETQVVAYGRAVRLGPPAPCSAPLGRIAHSPSFCVYARPGEAAAGRDGANCLGWWLR